MSAVVLLVETDQGEVVAVRFPSHEAAEAWEDAHDVTTMGVSRLVTTNEAIQLGGLS